MIETELQYRITKEEIVKFETAIATLIERGVDGDGDDDLFRRLQVDAMRSQLADLEAEVDTYEARRRLLAMTGAED